MRFLRGHWQLGLLALVVVLLWTTPVLWPLRLFVVFLHELSHAMAAWATGGSVISLDLSPMEGGLAVTAGGSRFVTLSAGYLGSLLWGVLFFVLALRTELDRWAVGLMGAAMLAVTALYIRTPFAMAYGAGAGLLLLAMARWLGHRANDVALRVFGLSSMLYVPEDILSDTIFRSHLHSDARMLAEEFGGATVIWGGLWFAAAAVVIVLTLRYGLGQDSNLWRREV